MTINEHCFGFFQKANFKLGFSRRPATPKKASPKEKYQKGTPGGAGDCFLGGSF